MERSEVLYHGSPNSGLKILSPNNINTRDKSHEHIKDGKVVFGINDFSIALMFMSPRPDDSWSKKDEDEGIYYLVISDEKRFRDNDKGGSVYEISTDNFYIEKDINEVEWLSKETVPVIKEYRFGNTLQTLVDHKVNVFFVDKPTFETMKTLSWEKRKEMLSKLDSVKK